MSRSAKVGQLKVPDIKTTAFRRQGSECGRKVYVRNSTFDNDQFTVKTPTLKTKMSPTFDCVRAVEERGYTNVSTPQLQTGARFKERGRLGCESLGGQTYTVQPDTHCLSQQKADYQTNVETMPLPRLRSDYPWVPLKFRKPCCGQKSSNTTIIIIEGRPINLQSDIICKHSKFLRDLINNEDAETVIKVDDVSFDVFSQIYRWMTKHEKIWATNNDANFKAILKAAVRLGLTELVKECTDSIEAKGDQFLECHNNLSAESLVGQSTTPTTLDKLQEMTFGEAFDMLSRDDIGFLSERQILEKGIKWQHLNRSQNDNGTLEQQLLSVVRWTRLSNKELVEFMLNGTHQHVIQHPYIQRKLLDALTYKLAVNENFGHKVRHLCDKPRIRVTNYCTDTED